MHHEGMYNEINDAIRGDVRYKDCLLVVCFEANSGSTNISLWQGYFENDRVRTGSVYFVKDVNKGRGTGFWTDHVRTMQAMNETRVIFEKEEIHFSDKFLSNEKFEVYKHITALQFRQHEVVPIKKGHPEHSEVDQRVTCSGKAHGPDDRCKTLQMGVYWIPHLMGRKSASGQPGDVCQIVTRYGSTAITMQRA